MIWSRSSGSSCKVVSTCTYSCVNCSFRGVKLVLKVGDLLGDRALRLRQPVDISGHRARDGVGDIVQCIGEVCSEAPRGGLLEKGLHCRRITLQGGRERSRIHRKRAVVVEADAKICKAVDTAVSGFRIRGTRKATHPSVRANVLSVASGPACPVVALIADCVLISPITVL